MKKIVYTLLICCLGLSAKAQNDNTSKPININTSFIEFAPTLSGDGKTMLFQSNKEGGGGFKLFETTLLTDGNWAEPKAIDKINDFAKPNYLIGGPCLSQDGKVLYFCAMPNNSRNDMDIFISTKNTKNEWSSPKNLGSPINTSSSETFPSISPDGKKLFYTVTTVKGKEAKCSKIMMSEINERNNWQKPIEITSPLNATCDKSPRVAYDNKTLFFASNKNGNYDLYHSDLSSSNSLSQPIALDYLNSQESELYASLLNSEELMYYSQNGDIYASAVPNKFKLHGISLEGSFTDIETGKPVTGKIFLIDTLAKDTLKKINVTGSYSINIPAGKKLKLYASAGSYYDYSTDYFPSIEENFKVQNTDIKLKPKRKEIVFKVSDKENSKGLKVKIKVTNLATKEETIMEANSGRDGKYAVSLREGNKYNIEISSIEGYAFTTTTVDVPLTSTNETIYASNPQPIDGAVSDAAPNFEIKLQPLRDNTKLALNDIHFLFNKFQLESESFIELEKVINLMNSNPSAKIEIAAHTDDVGSDDFNNNLSSKRAQEIVKYLNSKGISSARLKAKGYGKTKPLDPSNTEEARAKNRRVELKILDIE